jgi:hypothetical protein
MITRTTLWAAINAYARSIQTLGREEDARRAELNALFDELRVPTTTRKTKSISMLDYCRPEVQQFAIAMEARLRAKDGERGNSWKDLTAQDALDLASDRFEGIALPVRWRSRTTFSKTARRIVDVANYLMFAKERL